MKYGLHDTSFNKIVCSNSGLELYFSNGVYLLSEQGIETELSAPCRMIVEISGFGVEKIFEHITVKKIRKCKTIEIDFAEFLLLLENNTFSIDMDYYSFFSASILLKGYVGKYEIEFTITEVEKAEYLFDK